MAHQGRYLPQHPELPRTLSLIPQRNQQHNIIMRNRNRSAVSSDLDTGASDGAHQEGISSDDVSVSVETTDVRSISRGLEQSMSFNMNTIEFDQSLGVIDDALVLTAGGEVDILGNINSSSAVADEKSNFFPEWSWDRVRPWVALRRGDRYHPDQVDALANQDVVMLEKFNGHGYYGNTEKGSLEAARRIKSVNRKVKILFYLNAMVHYAGYAANDYFKDEWAMIDHITKSPYLWRDMYPSYNHTNTDFREWWINRALDMVSNDEIDGIFIDGLCKVDRADFPEKNHGIAYLETARLLRERLPEGKLLIGNVLRAQGFPDGNVKYMMYLDGSYLENWMNPGFVAKSLQLMHDALKQGQVIMLNAGPHNLDIDEYNAIKSLHERYEYLNDPKYIDFPLGCFLLIVEPYAYFSFHYGVDAAQGKMTVFDNNRFDAITRKLGKPLGKFVEESKGVFSREFEFVKVNVDINNQEGTITVRHADKESSKDNDDAVGDTLDDDDKIFDDDIADDIVNDDADDHF